MSSIYLVLFSFVVFYFGYKYYSSFVGKKIFQIKNNEITPANKYKDGVDFVPTPKKILFGHHFTSIAGVAPIIGPCIAVFWGWLPALLWVVLEQFLWELFMILVLWL